MRRQFCWIQALIGRQTSGEQLCARLAMRQAIASNNRVVFLKHGRCRLNREQYLLYIVLFFTSSEAAGYSENISLYFHSFVDKCCCEDGRDYNQSCRRPEGSRWDWRTRVVTRASAENFLSQNSAKIRQNQFKVNSGWTQKTPFLCCFGLTTLQIRGVFFSIVIFFVFKVMYSHKYLLVLKYFGQK